MGPAPLEKCPGFLPHTLNCLSTEAENLKAALDKYEVVRHAALTAKILIVNNTNIDVELLGYRCEWGYFYSKPEYAFGCTRSSSD